MKKLSTFLIAMSIICCLLFSLSGCSITPPNTREDAAELTFGKKASLALGTDDYYWYFFELDAETKIGLEGAKNDVTFYVFFADESEQMANIYSDFWSGTLDSGRYYVKIVCSNGNLFGSIVINITLHNIQELPQLPIGSEFSLDISKSDKRTYYKTALDADSRINVETYKHPDLKVTVVFYYKNKGFATCRLVFDYSDDFAVLGQAAQISAGECIVYIEYTHIPANEKMPKVPKTADLTISITE